MHIGKFTSEAMLLVPRPYLDNPVLWDIILCLDRLSPIQGEMHESVLPYLKVNFSLDGNLSVVLKERENAWQTRKTNIH